MRFGAEAFHARPARKLMRRIAVSLGVGALAYFITNLLSTDANEPTEPIESAEPTEPIDSTELRDPIESSELCDHSDSRE